MDELALTTHDAAPLVAPGSGERLVLAIVGWLAEKYSLSQSERTRENYRAAMGRFRVFLAQQRLDLDSDPAAVALMAQAWADSGEPSQATYNVRVSMVASFYEYAIRYDLLPGPNPTDKIKRSKVQPYAKARPIPLAQVIERLASIDRTTPQGMRDYALLALGVTTGRRLSELVNLNLGDVELHADHIVVIWQRVKGGRTARDVVRGRVARALREYLLTIERYRRDRSAGAPLWVNLSPAYEGQRLGRAGIVSLCESHLGTTKTHTLRHTFAGLLEGNGASLTQIQRKLGHVNPATTGLYLQNIAPSDDGLSGQIADLLGI